MMRNSKGPRIDTLTNFNEFVSSDLLLQNPRCSLKTILPDCSIRIYGTSSNSTLKYSGEDFPPKFLELDLVRPTSEDLNYFTAKLIKVVKYITKNPNNTNSNVAIGTYLMTCVVQRTLLDYSDKMTSSQVKNMKYLLNKGKYYVSHYTFINSMYGYHDIEYRISVLYKDTDVFARTINEFSVNRLQKWILNDFEMHPFIQSIDKAIMCKESYLRVIEAMNAYHVNITESDICLSHIMETPEPLNVSHRQPCGSDDYCKNCLLAHPSVGYALSHRLLNIALRSHVRRCYLQSVQEDEETIDQLCAFMYRETVYLARLGYFARDIFLEHVALCAIFGYREFHRLHWFHKVASWVDDQGCMHENRNFDINRTRIYKEATNSTKQKKKYTMSLKKMLLNECHTHPMTLLTIVLAHAIRYAAYLL